MRILHINANYIFTSLHQNMILNLNRLGISNSVFVPVSDAQAGVVEPIENVKVIECFRKYDRVWFGYKQKKIQNAIIDAFDIKSFDCIHAYTLFTDGNCALDLKKKFNIPYIVAVRNTDVNTFFKYMPHLRKKGVSILENAEKIIFLSESYKNTVLNKYVSAKKKEFIEKKCAIIPNGIDPFWLNNIYKNRDYEEARKRFEEKNVKIIYVGTIDENKNIELTISAINKLRSVGWNITYTVIGAVRNKRIYENNKNIPYIRFIDRLPKEELIKHYREADIFIMPSHHETFGLVYAEAMSQGLPVIYTKGQGFDGNFEDGEVGYSVLDKSTEDVVKSIKKCVRLYTQISLRCLKKVMKFDWGIINENYYNIYIAIRRR
ncbi:MAG: glycosyltransferase family 4 protein [Butyrivibrio sp.]|nr:glycosyltransferase family 4 protein [Butyrivibrio sp.]